VRQFRRLRGQPNRPPSASVRTTRAAYENLWRAEGYSSQHRGWTGLVYTAPDATTHLQQ
jgi:hypothetical protein